MIKGHSIFLVTLFLVCSVQVKCQLNMVGASFTNGLIQDKESGLDQSFIGLTGSIEVPIKELSARFEYSYLLPGDNQSSLSLEELSYWGLSAGYILRAQRFQVPLFIGAGKYTSSGSIQLDDWSIGIRSGLRFYVTERVALFGEASYHHIIAGETQIDNGITPLTISSLTPNSPQLHIGVLFSYINKQ